MEFMEIYEFLLPEAGAVIIPPTEIVTKSGADFDVDKMTVMMPNLITTVRGTELNSGSVGYNKQDIKGAKEKISNLYDDLKEANQFYNGPFR